MSWSIFFILLFIVAVIYNTGVLFFYFKGDLSSLIGRKKRSDKLVASTASDDVPTNKRSFVGLVRSDSDQRENIYNVAEPAPVISAALKASSNGIFATDLETCLNHMGRTIKEDHTLDNSIKDMIKGIIPNGEVHLEYNNGKDTLKKRIDVFENIVQL